MNGLRAVWQKGFKDWLQKTRPDILGLQEIKCQPDQVEELLAPLEENYTITLAPAKKKGYSGVAVFIDKSLPIVQVQIGLGVPEFDDEGRTIIIETDDSIIFNSYYPNGQRDHGRVPYKLRYSEEVLKQALELKRKTKKNLILMGDFNTAHHPIDLARPKSNIKTTGFLPIEREFLDKCQSQGLVDAFRHFHPGQPDHYTWWTYRGQCREKNIGWRIDYFFICQDALAQVKTSYHLPQVMGSDHCPIALELKAD